MELKKAGSKKQDHFFSKKEEAAWPLLFQNNNDPVFCTLLFALHNLDLLKKSSRPSKNIRPT